MSAQGRMLFASDIAKERARLSPDRPITVRSAQRWLAALEKEHGAAVVGRIGNRLYTTVAALEKVAPRWRGPEGDFEQRLKDCEDTIDHLSREVKRLTSGLRRNAT